MPPTLIVRGASLEDLIAPASNVFWREGYGRYDVGSWESRPLIGAGGSSANAAGPNDRTIKVLLPLESTGKVQEYLFIFDVHARAAALDDQAQVPEIKIVRDRAKIQDCRLLGMIEAHPPYIWPGDDFKQLTRKASSLGADTILVPGSRIGTVEGEAYRCAGN